MNISISLLILASFIQVQERQKRRKVADIKKLMSSTLEPCMSSHGLKPTTLVAETSEGMELTIPLDNSPTTLTEPKRPTDTVSKALYLLDRFAVSDEFYHELAQVNTVICTLK